MLIFQASLKTPLSKKSKTKYFTKNGVQFEIGQSSSTSSDKYVGSSEKSIEAKIDSFKRTSLPINQDFKYNNINLKELKKAMAKGALELEKNILSGNLPAFGYPTVWFGNEHDDDDDQEGL